MEILRHTQEGSRAAPTRTSWVVKTLWFLLQANVFHIVHAARHISLKQQFKHVNMMLITRQDWQMTLFHVNKLRLGITGLGWPGNDSITLTGVPYVWLYIWSLVNKYLYTNCIKIYKDTMSNLSITRLSYKLCPYLSEVWTCLPPYTYF